MYINFQSKNINPTFNLFPIALSNQDKTFAPTAPLALSPTNQRPFLPDPQIQINQDQLESTPTASTRQRKPAHSPQKTLTHPSNSEAACHGYSKAKLPPRQLPAILDPSHSKFRQTKNTQPDQLQATTAYPTHNPISI
ncbi:hypothetical protein DSO57_1012750 [Entomophthora muscae]|uniref:Uncharacterized protein n=1 Tax=Entomophthora muscae TaxID=34485 RepID=A0ACC2SV28_9FUNG|nr:hypothetical protein DSO57_1012750 [Entomophthora muscae]